MYDLWMFFPGPRSLLKSNKIHVFGLVFVGCAASCLEDGETMNKKQIYPQNGVQPLDILLFNYIK